MAKGIAYVLRNPSVGEEERQEFLGELQGSLDRLMAIVDEVITMSELERGTFQLVLADVDLAPTVARAVDAARTRHPTIPIDASIAPSLRTVADEQRLVRRGRRAARQCVPVLARGFPGRALRALDERRASW